MRQIRIPTYFVENFADALRKRGKELEEQRECLQTRHDNLVISLNAGETRVYQCEAWLEMYGLDEDGEEKNASQNIALMASDFTTVEMTSNQLDIVRNLIEDNRSEIQEAISSIHRKMEVLLAKISVLSDEIGDIESMLESVDLPF